MNFQRADDGVSPVVASLVLLSIVVILSIVVFGFLLSMGDDPGESATSSTTFSETEDELLARLHDGGSAERVKYILNGDTVYTITDVSGSIGETIRFSNYGQLCEADEVSVISEKGSSQSVSQTHTVSSDLNCKVPARVTADLQHDGDVWVADIFLTNTADEPREFALVLSDGDLIELANPNDNIITLEPGESIDYTTELTSFSSDDSLTVGVTSDGSNFSGDGTGSGDDGGATLSGGTLDGGDSLSWSGTGSSDGSSYHFSPDDSHHVPKSDTQVTVDDTTDESDVPISLSTRRVKTGNTVELVAYLKSSYDTQVEETMTVYTTRSNPEAKVQTETTHTLEPQSTTEAKAAWTFDRAGEYDVSISLGSSPKMYSAGTVTVLPDSALSLVDSSVATSSGTTTVTADIENTGSDAGDVTVVYFEDGEEFARESGTVAASSTESISTSLPTRSTFTQYHVGVLETGDLQLAGYTGDVEGDFAVDISQSDDTVDQGETVSYSANIVEDGVTKDDVSSITWKYDGTTFDTGTFDTSYTHDESGSHEVSATLELNNGDTATAYTSVGVLSPDAYSSCMEILNADPNAESGMYAIEPVSNTEVNVYCDMDTDGGGWTGFDTNAAKEMVDALDGGGLTGYNSIRQIGFRTSADRPYYVNNNDGGARYDVPLGFTYDEFYMDSVRFRPSSFIVGSDTSEYLVHTGSYTMSDWSETLGNSCDGDIGFGSPSDSGPAATFAESGSSFEANGNGGGTPDLATFYANGNIFPVSQDSTFRMQFTENCGQDEGWVWYDGRFFVR